MNAPSPTASTSAVHPPLLGRLKRQDAREVWAHEALGFTPWLLENLDLLGEALGLTIESGEREVSVGDFNVDLIGRVVETGQTVIVENQLEATDHRHLGQLITYAAGLEASYVVWLTPQFRDEHRRALDWLNEVTREGLSFFGVELELLQIEAHDGALSSPAPHFRLAAQPNNWQKRARSIADADRSDQPTERQLLYRAFFRDLIQEVKNLAPDATRMQDGSYKRGVRFPTGRTGILYWIGFTGDERLVIELRLDSADIRRNKLVFDRLYSDKSAIEAELHESLQWEFLGNRKRIRIASYEEGRITDPPERLAELKTLAIERFLAFRKVFSSRLQQIFVSLYPDDVSEIDQDGSPAYVPP
jgi:hypothetical protein